jgi:hypothetical protein
VVKKAKKEENRWKKAIIMVRVKVNRARNSRDPENYLSIKSN